MNYSNWGSPGLGPSMLSHNSCYWIQSSSGLWRPGACANVTMGVVCKLPRGERPVHAPLGLLPPPRGRCWAWARGWRLILPVTQRMGGHEETGPGAAGTLPWDKRVCRRDWPFLQTSRLDSKPIIL